MVARSTKKYKRAVFFGLQPYLKKIAQPITKEHGEEFFAYWEMILGNKPPQDVVDCINQLTDLGHFPIEIKSVAEGSIVDNGNILVTVTNTLPGFHWCVGLIESLLLKVWAPTSVATLSNQFKDLVTAYAKETSDSEFLIPFLIHDFGYRGVSSEETAEICGAAHLINFMGSDTVPAVKFLKENYFGEGMIGVSVPASEHSIHCSFGPTEQDELDYVNHMLDLNPTGLLSVVSDAYDYWRMLTVTLPKVKDRILARDGKYVVRPDSGQPKEILCGVEMATYESLDLAKEYLEDDVYEEAEKPSGKMTTGESQYKKYAEVDGKTYELIFDVDYNRHDKTFYYVDEVSLASCKEVELTPQQKGTFRILEELFGSTVNSKNYRELNPKVGVIYGDGMYYARFLSILENMKEMKFASTNLVAGIGGLLLQQHNRDDLGFAFKATFAVIDGVEVELFKDPITDPGKKSHKGRMALIWDKDAKKYITLESVSELVEALGHLHTVFLNGKITVDQKLNFVRANVENHTAAYNA